MSDKTNEEKLRILQERLAQIQNKQEVPTPTISTEQVAQTTQPKEEIAKVKRKPIALRWMKYVILFSIAAYSGFYIYNNVDFATIIADFTTKKSAEEVEAPLTYTFNFDDATHIIILGSFDDERDAKVMVKEKRVQGYTTDYFFMPAVSNTDNEVYKVYTGPYYSTEETNQWAHSLEEGTFEVLEL